MNNSADMKEFFGIKTGKFCFKCKKSLTGYFYEKKPLCYSCYKSELHSRNRIRDIVR